MLKLKKFLSVLLVLSMALPLLVTVASADEEDTPPSQDEQRAYIMENQPGAVFDEEIAELFGPEVVSDGDYITVPPGEPSSLLRNNRTFVAVRFAVEELGGSADYDRSNPGHWWVWLDNKTIEGYAGDSYVTVNGEIVQLDAPLFVTYTWTGTYYGARNYIPLRFVAEQFGFDVDWYKDTVMITSQGTDPSINRKKVDEENPFYNLKVKDDSIKVTYLLNGTPVALNTNDISQLNQDIISAVGGIDDYTIAYGNDIFEARISADFTYGVDGEEEGSISTSVTASRVQEDTPNGLSREIYYDTDNNMIIYQSNLVTDSYYSPADGLLIYQGNAESVNNEQRDAEYAKKYAVNMRTEIRDTALGEIKTAGKIIGPVLEIFSRYNSLNDFMKYNNALQNNKYIDPELKSEYDDLLFAKWILGMTKPFICQGLGMLGAAGLGAGEGAITYGIGAVQGATVGYWLAFGIGMTITSAADAYLDTRIEECESRIKAQQGHTVN